MTDRSRWRVAWYGGLLIAIAASVAVVAVLLRHDALWSDSERTTSGRALVTDHAGADARSGVTGRRSSPTPGSLAGASAARDADWATLYYEGMDAYDFVARAAVKALAGDAAAAYYVEQVVLKCFAREREPWNAMEPDAALVEKWAKIPNAPQDVIDNDRDVMHFCLHYLRADPFAALPPRPGGYKDWRFWAKLAYESGYPPALAEHAVLSMAGLPESSDAYNAAITQVQVDVKKVLESGDPRAVFALGMLFDAPANRITPNKSMVVRLAACQLGYDCTLGNPELEGFSRCVQLGTCAAATEFQDLVRHAMTPDDYAAIYARAQELADAIRRGDAAALESFSRLPLKRVGG